MVNHHDDIVLENRSSPYPRLLRTKVRASPTPGKKQRRMANLSIDCKTPRYHGARYEPENVQIVHVACNAYKWVYTEEQGRLISALIAEAAASGKIVLDDDGFIQLAPGVKKPRVDPLPATLKAAQRWCRAQICILRSRAELSWYGNGKNKECRLKYE